MMVNDGVYEAGETVTPGYTMPNRVVITKDITDAVTWEIPASNGAAFFRVHSE
ncbi:hypothetical protein [Pontiella agarivorans]|uniref:Uncharacterized protein n=1 Tax=Pontiella agarivorans TaxID=3038953 RepID=A0ABU5MXP5_9BACT|nr:hypothetical protein [Pontiella agarivorans]MDZ8118937.1 hypothetical protein [Pontiella agarivorans]